MAAAARAAECGVRVGLVDDNVALGGQIWRGAPEDHPESASWAARLRSAGVTALSGLRVFHQPEPGVLLAEGREDIHELRYEKLILATGARERFLPLPGWTLPNVMGAGGLQAMVKSGLPIADKRVVVAGTGPLLLAVAAYLRKRGAKVLVVCEQTSWSRLAGFAATLVRFPSKISQSLELKKNLAGIPFAANSWPTAAQGTDRLESVHISRSGALQDIACDYLACGFHLAPNTELALLLGCRMSGDFVQVDEFQQTTVPGVYCAGEPTRIGGVECALVEGQIAGLAAAGKADLARLLFHERSEVHRFARALERTFRLRDELKALPADASIICRCEDVTHVRLIQHSSWRAAKLHTRCGMGPCQGRVCGPATKFLYGWSPDSVRPPIFPARVESLSALVAGGTEPKA